MRRAPARLFKHSGDGHYLEVARLLLRITKLGLAIPGRLNGLPGPGWQLENFNLCPPNRGFGSNKLWLPWVPTCQLHGIVFTEYRMPELFEKLMRPDW